MEFYCCGIYKSEINEDLTKTLADCNKVLEEDFGPGHTLNECPDLLVLARNKDSDVVGLLCLHFHEKTFAWEIGSCAARMPYRHTVLFKRFMEYLPRDLTLYYRRNPTLERKAYLVRRLKGTETRTIEAMKALCFKVTEWLEAILSDEGYIPFEPTDEILIKKKIFPNVYTGNK